MVEQNIEQRPLINSAKERSGRNEAKSVILLFPGVEDPRLVGFPVDGGLIPDVATSRHLFGFTTSSNKNSWYLPRMDSSAHPFRSSMSLGTFTEHPARMTLNGIAGMKVL